MMRAIRFTFCCVVLALCSILQAQVPDLHPQRTFTPVPTVSFSFELSGGEPSYYSISVMSTGDAAYRSSGTSIPGVMAGDPFIEKFVISAPERARIFQLAQKLGYFQGNFEYRKGHLANTGSKTLYYTDEKTKYWSTYNYSTNPDVQALTHLFQGISATLEFGKHLEYYYDHQKLGLDEELKHMQEMASGGDLKDLQAVAPVLKKIADDPAVMHIDREHARRLLQMAQTETP